MRATEREPWKVDIDAALARIEEVSSSLTVPMTTGDVTDVGRRVYVLLAHAERALTDALMLASDEDITPEEKAAETADIVKRWGLRS